MSPDLNEAERDPLDDFVSTSIDYVNDFDPGDDYGILDLQDTFRLTSVLLVFFHQVS